MWKVFLIKGKGVEMRKDHHDKRAGLHITAVIEEDGHIRVSVCGSLLGVEHVSISTNMTTHTILCVDLSVGCVRIPITDETTALHEVFASNRVNNH